MCTSVSQVDPKCPSADRDGDSVVQVEPRQSPWCLCGVSGGLCVSPRALSQKPYLLYGGGHEKDEQNIFNETNKNAKEDLMFKETINQN